MSLKLLYVGVKRSWYRRFSRDVIAAMLVDENKRSLISFFCLSTYISLLFLVSQEVGLKRPMDQNEQAVCVRDSIATVAAESQLINSV